MIESKLKAKNCNLDLVGSRQHGVASYARALITREIMRSRDPHCNTGE